MSGIEKEIDNLGRIVLPVDFRRKLGIKSKDAVLISLTDSSITITPIQEQCAICGIRLRDNKKLRLCPDCIAKIKANN